VPEQTAGGPEKIRLKTAPEQGSHVEILGHGMEAVPKIMAILKGLRIGE
jgi:hypothetical protein